MPSFRIGDIVLYKNNQLVAFNKPAGLPVQADRTGDKSLLDLAEIYGKSKSYLIHRIDRPVSGVVLLAKSKNALVKMTTQWKNKQVTKTYLAVVKNAPENPAGELVHYLKKDGRNNKSKVCEENATDAKKAVLTYKTIGSSDSYHLLEVQIETGRHHQIRAQLAAIGCPIKGDVKYGFKRNNADKSIHLHAWKLRFSHPISGKQEEVIAPLPDEVVWNAFGM